MPLVTKTLLIAALCCTATGIASAHSLQPAQAVALSAVAQAANGWVGVHVVAAPGSVVALSEISGGVAQPLQNLSVRAGELEVPHTLAWRCDRRVRQINASAVAPDGTLSTATVSVRTPSCADRFGVTIGPRTAVLVGRRLTVSVRDNWGTGNVDASVCLRVRSRSACRPVAIAATELRASVRLAVTRAGVGEVSVSGEGFAVRERLEVRARHAPLRLLATGDSMIQLIDSQLAARLRRDARVTSDARISTGISKSLMFNWVAHAQGSAARVRPQATVMFIGANDGFAIGGVACCEEKWVAAYAKRVKAMMSDYRRGGAGRVYWLTIPTPRDNARKEIYRAVNTAIEQAAESFAPDEVSVIDLVKVFTPGGVFRSSIKGRTVRQGDGIHLNVAGAKIAAGVVVTRLRSDGLIS